MPAQNPWDRRRNETSPAFAAFRAYLELGPTRSTAKATQQLGRRPGYKNQMDEWSRVHDWQDRIAAYEQHEARLKDEAAFSVVTQRERARKMAEQSQLSQEALTQIDVAFLKRVNKDLREGRDPFKGVPTEAMARLVALAARARRGPAIIERLSRGMSTENVGNADGSRLDGKSRAEGMLEDELASFVREHLAAEDET